MDRKATKTDTIIGARIRTRRIELGVSQEQLAGAIGVTFQQVQKYEKGINRVSSSTLMGIADHLGVSINQLLPGPTAAAGQSEALAPPQSAEEMLLLAAFRKVLSPHARKTIVDLTQQLAGEDG